MNQLSDSAACHSDTARRVASYPLCLTRPYNGIGDWLFCLAVLKLVNRQRPDIPIYVDFTVKGGLTLPRLVPEAFEASDVIYTAGRPVGPALFTNDSLVYRAYPPANYVESTVLHLNQQTGLNIEFEPDVLPSWGIQWEPPGSDYIVMISHGKRRDRHAKEWGYKNLDRLADMLASAGHKIIQVGSAHDGYLNAARDRYLGRPFHEVAPLLANARAYIGLENGIAVLAGWLGVPTCVIYDGHSWPDRLEAPRLCKIPERIEPGPAFERINTWLGTLPC